MPLSPAQFNTVKDRLGPLLRPLGESREANDAVYMNTYIANEELNAPNRDHSREPIDVINPIVRASITSFHRGQVEAYDEWFSGVGSTWHALEDIRVAFVFHKDDFEAMLSTLAPETLDELDRVFRKLAERPSLGTIIQHVKPTSAQIYRKMILSDWVFQDIADRCKEVAAQKRIR